MCLSWYFRAFLLVLCCSIIRSENQARAILIEPPCQLEQSQGCHMYCLKLEETLTATNVWKTIKVIALCKKEYKKELCTSNPGIIVGGSENELAGSCEQRWLPRYIAPWESNEASISPFKRSCFVVISDNTFKLAATVHDAYLNHVTLFIFGVILFFSAPTLSSNVLFYYSSGISIGVIGSLLVFVYILSRMVPKKSFAFAILAVGWSSAFYFGHWVVDNYLTMDYREYFAGYVVVAALISFAVCYYYGPIRNERSQKLVQWTIQLCALLCIYFSTHETKAAIAIVCIVLLTNCMTFKMIQIAVLKISWMWRRKKKHRFLTEQEYKEQARKETKTALEELRQECLSPKIETWRTVSHLESPKRFAKFVLGESHLSGDEITAYDSDISLPDDDDDTSSELLTDDISLQSNQLDSST